MGAALLDRTKDWIPSMRKREAVITGSFVTALLLTLGGFAAVNAVGGTDGIVEAKLERACHRELARRTPHGLRGVETRSYRLEGRDVGILRGSLQSRYTGSGWSSVNWVCRVHPASGRILRVKFAGRPGGGGQILAAARYF